MRKPLLSLNLIVLLSFALNTVSAQCLWLNYGDETSARLSLSSIPSSDDEEKDIAQGDFDNDGWTDIVIVRKTPFSNPGARADVLLMNENGVLVDRTSTYAPEFISRTTDARDIHVADFNNDGWLDMIVVSTFEDQPQYYRNMGESAGVWQGLSNVSSTDMPFLTVGPLQFCAGWAGDVTGDGWLDFYLVNYFQGGGVTEDVLLINDGTGGFTDESSSRLGILRNSRFGTTVEIHDVDNDGDQDIIKNNSDVAGLTNPFFDTGVFTLFNDGTGNFSSWEKVPSNASYMFAGADFDDNGRMDFYVVDDGQDYTDLATAASPDVSVSYNQVFPSYSPRTTGFGGNVKAADLDNDGDSDIGVSSADVDIPPCESTGLRKFALIRNNGGGDMEAELYLSTQIWNQSNYDFEAIDIDNDGKLDLFLAQCNGYQVLIQGDPLAPSAVLTDASSISATDGAIDLTIGAGVGFYFYEWSNGATTQDISGLAPGTYSVSITNLDGCSDWLEVEVGSGGVSNCVNAPSGLTSSVTASGATLSWVSNASEGVLAYRIRGRPMGLGSFSFLPGVVLEPSTSVTVNAAVLTPGLTYEWRVIGGCELDGSVLSPWSLGGFFTALSPRLEDESKPFEIITQTPAQLIITVNPSFVSDGNFRIFDALGIQHAAFPANQFDNGVQTLYFDLPELAAGLYFLDGGNGQTQNFRIVD
ncbi:MAG: hypothetical protein ACI959_000243 [Limisphaerales bacterium]|jgi:hypothetical protein